MTRVSTAVAICLLLPATAFASLGGTVTSVEADRVETKSALMGIKRNDSYTIHEILTPTGTTIREYYGSSGIVFGVAWDGEWPPDLRQLLGTYFDQYQRSVQSARRAGRARGRLAIDEGGLVVQAFGRTHAFSGAAYAPGLMPAGVAPDVVR